MIKAQQGDWDQMDAVASGHWIGTNQVCWNQALEAGLMIKH